MKKSKKVVGNKNIPIEKGESLDQAILGLIHET
jgi:hypothetical protein